MNIIDLGGEYHDTYFKCLEDWSEELIEAGGHKAGWFALMRDKGLRVKLAVEDGLACGMIQYLPIEHAFAEGRSQHFVLCIWVHGYKDRGVGYRQKRGLGRALLQAAEEDARALGSQALVAWGLSLPFWMKASWFRRQGYKKVDQDGQMVLLWKPFTSEALPPRWIKKRRIPGRTPGRVNVTAFLNGWCPAQCLTFERAKRAAAEFPGKVDFQAVSTLDRDTYLDWGIADGLFIDGRQVRTGPPPSYDKIRRKIARRIRKL